MELNTMAATAVAILTAVGLKLLGALAVWIVGRWLIGLAVRAMSASLTRQHVDETLASYLRSGVQVLLTIALIVAILGLFGVETTTFAALVAAGGVAIGVAWGGLLSNFAAGVFLVVLRPFRAGDVVTVGGVTGSVEEVGLFGSVLNTPDGVRTILGNAKIFGDTIQNFSANPVRRVDLVAQLAHGVDPATAITLLRARVAAVPNVLDTPAPCVEILEFSPAGPMLAVRPSCRPADYWQVYFDVNRAIAAAFADAGYPTPAPRTVVQQAPAA
jgi:small conductance mechanosensitive channel